jgi:hypothetical protein
VPAARLVLAGALLVVAFAGLRTAVPAADWTSGPWHDHGTPLGIGLEVVFAALLTAVQMRRRSWPDARQPTIGLRSLLRAVLIFGLLAIPVLILLNRAGKIRPLPPRHRARPPGPVPPTRLPHQPPVHPASHGAAPLVLYALLAAAGLAIIVVCVVRLRRHLRGINAGYRGDLTAEDEPAEQLRRAVRSGQAALQEIDDARLAIIACYAAMEQSLARAGTVRGDAETPDELLARAAADGLVHGAEAAQLTALFYEARFSSHPLPPQRRDEARQALRVLAASLREQGERAAAAAARAGAAQDPPGSPA